MFFLVEVGIVCLVVVVGSWLLIALIKGIINLVIYSILGAVGFVCKLVYNAIKSVLGFCVNLVISSVVGMVKLIYNSITHIVNIVINTMGLIVSPIVYGLRWIIQIASYLWPPNLWRRFQSEIFVLKRMVVNSISFMLNLNLLRMCMGIPQSQCIVQYPTMFWYIKRNIVGEIIIGSMFLNYLYGTYSAVLLAMLGILVTSIYISKLYEKMIKLSFLMVCAVFPIIFIWKLTTLSYLNFFLVGVFFISVLSCYKKYKQEKKNLMGVEFWRKDLALKIGILNAFGISTILSVLLESNGYFQIFPAEIVVLSVSLFTLRDRNTMKLYHMLCDSTKEQIFLNREDVQTNYLKFLLLHEKNIVMENKALAVFVSDYNKQKELKSMETEYGESALVMYDELVKSRLYPLIVSYLKDIDSIFEAALEKNIIYTLRENFINIQAITSIIKELCIAEQVFDTNRLLKEINQKNPVENIRSFFTDEDILLLTNMTQYPLEKAYKQSGKEILYIDLQHVSNFLICDGCHCLVEEPYKIHGDVFCSKECAEFIEKCDNFLMDYKAKKAAEKEEYISGKIMEDKPDLATAIGMGIGIAETVKFAEETKMFSTPRGHGFAAEQANTLFDQVALDDAKVIGGDNLKDGADRLVNGQLIQSKYCKTGSKCIAECFDGDRFRYVDRNGYPMQIEVPSDKYFDAVKAMENRIKKGQMPGITDPKEAGKIVRKGHFSYEQAKNIAKAGTFESITFDTAKGIQIGVEAGAFTFFVSFGVGLWKGKDKKEAFQEAAYAAGNIAMKQGAITLIQGQAAKSIMLRNGTKVIGSLVKETTKYIGLPKFMVKELSDFFKGNTVTVAVTVIVLSVDDIFKYFDHQITFTQLAKNVGKLATGLGGAYLGGVAGGTAVTSAAGMMGLSTAGLGTAGITALASTGPVGWAILAGGAIGAAVGGKIGSWLGKKIFGDDEAKRRKEEREERAEAQRRIQEMYPILKMYFAYLAETYLLTDEECKVVLKKIEEIGIQNVLLSIYDKKNRIVYLNIVLRPIFIETVMKRQFISAAESHQIVEKFEQAMAS